MLKSSNLKKKILTFQFNSKKNFFLVSIHKSFRSSHYEKLGGEFYNLIKETNNDIQFTVNTNGSIIKDNLIQYFLHGLKLKSYEFDKYKTKKEKKNITIFVIGKNIPSQQIQKKFKAIEDGTFFARDLIPFTFCLLSPQLFNWVFDNLLTTFAFILFLHFFLNFKKTELAAATLIC